MKALDISVKYYGTIRYNNQSIYRLYEMLFLVLVDFETSRSCTQ